jgi:hypothetical protein
VLTLTAEVAVKVADGSAFTTPVTLNCEVQPLDDVTVTVYTPAFAAVTLAIVGFCRADVKLFGPDHE